MGLGLNLKVNRLPARTWNWLDMNEASLKQIEAGDEHTVITEGIAKEVTGTESWQKEFSAIATGMGADMDRLAREANVSPIRIQSAAQSAAQSESQYGSQYGSGSGAFQDNRRAALHFVFGDGKKSFQPVEILVREGEMLAKAGLPLRPRDLAGLQMGGITRVTVWKKPVVAFIPSGSELIAPGTPLSRGKNIDTNSLLMRETLKEMGATPLCLPIVRDDGQEMADALNRAMPQADIIVMGGGSSKGEEDYTATLLHQQGKVLCHGAQAVPGKPLCAAIIDGKPVINLPGPFMAAYHGLEWCINGLVSNHV